MYLGIKAQTSVPTTYILIIIRVCPFLVTFFHAFLPNLSTNLNELLVYPLRLICKRIGEKNIEIYIIQ